MKLTQCPAKSEPQEGGSFDLYMGTILGQYVSLEENKSIVMKWKMKDWGETLSDVTLTIEENGSDVRIK